MTTNATGPGPLHAFMLAMIKGVPKLPPTVTSITVLGTTYNMAEFVLKVQTYETVYSAAEQAALDYQMALDERGTVEPDAIEFMAAARTSFKGALGKKAAILEEVGVTPDKVPTPLTVDQKAHKVALSNATRKARNTMGKKAKSKIKGQLPPKPTTP